MKKSQLRQIIKEEISNIVSEEENIGEKHISQIKDILNTLSTIHYELDSEEYTGFGAIDGDMKKLIVKSMENLSKLPRLIKNNIE